MHSGRGLLLRSGRPYIIIITVVVVSDIMYNGAFH